MDDLDRLHLARVRARRLLREAVAALDARAPIEDVLVQLTVARDRAQQVLLVESAMAEERAARTPIPCPPWCDT